MKQYIIGKVLDPELKVDSNHVRSFVFGLYSHRESKEFTIAERFLNSDTNQYTENPLFKKVCNLKEGSYVLALVRNSVATKGGYVVTWLDNVFLMDEYCRDAILCCLTGSSSAEVVS